MPTTPVRGFKMRRTGAFHRARFNFLHHGLYILKMVMLADLIELGPEERHETLKLPKSLLSFVVRTSSRRPSGGRPPAEPRALETHGEVCCHGTCCDKGNTPVRHPPPLVPHRRARHLQTIRQGRLGWREGGDGRKACGGALAGSFPPGKPKFQSKSRMSITSKLSDFIGTSFLLAFSLLGASCEWLHPLLISGSRTMTLTARETPSLTRLTPMTLQRELSGRDRIR